MRLASVEYQAHNDSIKFVLRAPIASCLCNIQMSSALIREDRKARTFYHCMVVVALRCISGTD